MKSREEKEYEERVKRRVLILRDLLEEGKIFFAESMKDELDKSFSQARYDDNGEPDLSTIDGRIRSIALMAEHYDYREKMKSEISLYQIQEKYFEIFELNFGHFYKMMIEKQVTPHKFAEFIAYNSKSSENLNNVIEPILEDLNNFWEITAETAYLHLEDDYKSIKAVFGGDLFPANNENIASKCGIYTDTIILPCPFIRSRHMFKIWDKNQRVYYLVKHALNILQYRDLALAEVNKPIVVIVADKEMIDEFAFDEIQRLGEKDCLYHAKKVFGREFKNFEELADFGKSLDTIDKVLKELKEPHRVLFDTDFKEPLAEQIKNQIKGQSGQMLRTQNPGLIVSTLGLGRMGVSNEILLKAAKVGGVPLIDAPTSWQYFKWKLEYDGERTIESLNITNTHILKGLNDLNYTNLQWIGKIPTDGLIEIRKSGAIEEIRKVLSQGIDDIALADHLDFNSTSKKVFENLNIAFENHQKNIKELVNKKWKIAGKDFGSWLVMGSLEIASAYTGTPIYGVPTVVLSQLLDAPKLKDLPDSIKTIKQLEKEKQNLKKSPIGLMFNYK
jgi:hypothetical protein